MPRPAYDLVIRSRQAVLPGGTRAAAVAVSGQAIAAIDGYTAPFEADRDIDLGDLALLPGLVDTHVHVNEPGRTEWEGFTTATRAAAAGGVTTICDMPLNSVPPTVSVAALREKRTAASREVLGGRGVLGRRGAGERGLAAAPARGRGGRVQVLPARLRGTGVPAPGRGGAAVRARLAGRAWTRC